MRRLAAAAALLVLGGCGGNGTLEPGDVVLTGTSAGVGLSTGALTKVGDRLDGEITGLGSLHVEIVEDR